MIAAGESRVTVGIRNDDCRDRSITVSSHLLPLSRPITTGTFGDSVQGCFCIALSLLYGLKASSFQRGFKFGNKSARVRCG